MIRIAIVGCGAVADRLHAPAIAASGVATLTAVVDIDAARARAVAATAGAPDARVAREPGEIVTLCDAAIIALPNHLHANAAAVMLAHRCAVLVEKPMATTTDACDRMIALASVSGAVLSAAMVRRFDAAHRFVRQAIDDRMFGAVRRVTVRDGLVYTWPASSAFFVKHAEAGGGVLVDVGAHVLDALTWWLGPLSLTAYYDDACGGVEAECRLELTAADGVAIDVELSRLRRMSNSARVECDGGVIEINTYSGAVDLIPNAGPAIRGHAGRQALRAWAPPTNAFVDQLRAFAGDIEGGAGVTATARAAREVAVLFEACTRIRQPLVGPASPLVAASAGFR